MVSALPSPAARWFSRYTMGEGFLGLPGGPRSWGAAGTAAGVSSAEFCVSESSEEKLLWLDTWKYCAASPRGCAEPCAGGSPQSGARGGEGDTRRGGLRSWEGFPLGRGGVPPPRVGRELQRGRGEPAGERAASRLSVPAARPRALLAEGCPEACTAPWQGAEAAEPSHSSASIASRLCRVCWYLCHAAVQAPIPLLLCIRRSCARISCSFSVENSTDSLWKELSRRCRASGRPAGIPPCFACSEHCLQPAFKHVICKTRRGAARLLPACAVPRGSAHPPCRRTDAARAASPAPPAAAPCAAGSSSASSGIGPRLPARARPRGTRNPAACLPADTAPGRAGAGPAGRHSSEIYSGSSADSSGCSSQLRALHAGASVHTERLFWEVRGSKALGVQHISALRGLALHHSDCAALSGSVLLLPCAEREIKGPDCLGSSPRAAELGATARPWLEETHFAQRSHCQPELG